MKFSHFFIDRPIFAAVISIVIVILGVVSYFNLPVSQYPEITPPTIQVTASYPGASPEILAKTVAQPIEQEVNGVENMLYMDSSSTVDGTMTLTVTFAIGTNVDEAQVLVQNRVAIAEPRLPAQVRALGVTTRKSSPDLMLVAHVLSPDQSVDQLYISNYVNIQIKDELSRIDGVGNVTVFGARDYSMRIWLNPDKLGALGLTAADVVSALQAQNVQVAAGSIGQPPLKGREAFQYTVLTQGRLDNAKEFEQVVVKTGSNGRIVRLQDVGRVELGAETYTTNSYLNGKPAVGIGIFQRPGTNALTAAQAVRDKLEELSKRFPPGLTYDIAFDPTVFVQESVSAVYHTLGEAALLVILVILIFLQSWRATIIPLAAIPVSLIGTFGAMAALGFSLNSLSLFGLVLAIGIVVDDAIVVVENVERHISDGMSPREASRTAMTEVGGALVATALVLSAVFIPTAFLGGITGQFFRQFALTIAFSTVISALVSLTLSPALTALMLQPHDAEPDWFTRMQNKFFGWFFRGFNWGFNHTAGGYTSAVTHIVRHVFIGLLVYAGLLALTWLGFSRVPGGFIPAQDQGYLIIDGQLPEAASLQRTDAVAQRVMKIALDTPGIGGAVGIVGFSGATRANSSNAFAVFTPLDSFDKRGSHSGQSAMALSATLNRKLSAIEAARVTVIPPPPVRGLGTAGGFKLYVRDRENAGIEPLQNATQKLAAAIRKDPSSGRVFTTFQTNTPTLFANIDRIKAQKLGVPLGSIFSSLQTFLGSTFVNDLNLFGRTFHVTAEAEERFRDSPADVSRFKVRSDSGAMVPLGSLLKMERRVGPNRVQRFNLFTAAPINGSTAPGYSSGQSIAAVEKLAPEVLPKGMDFAWTDIAFQEKAAGNTALFIFPLCVLFVFLALAAQYESWSLPLSVILIVPMCLLSSIAGIWLRGMDNNILTKIGFIVLVGLACKNAILIVEFAKQQEEEGKNRFDAAIEAARLRLRPILMTSFAFILGTLPLVLASGPGAESRQAMGTAVFFGMLGVTFFGLLLTPIFYVAIRRFSKKPREPGEEEEGEEEESAEAAEAEPAMEGSH